MNTLYCFLFNIIKLSLIHRFYKFFLKSHKISVRESGYVITTSQILIHVHASVRHNRSIDDAGYQVELEMEFSMQTLNDKIRFFGDATKIEQTPGYEKNINSMLGNYSFWTGVTTSTRLNAINDS